MGPSISMNVGPVLNLQTTDVSSPIFANRPSSSVQLLFFVFFVPSVPFFLGGIFGLDASLFFLLLCYYDLRQMVCVEQLILRRNRSFALSGWAGTGPIWRWMEYGPGPIARNKLGPIRLNTLGSRVRSLPVFSTQTEL